MAQIRNLCAGTLISCLAMLLPLPNASAADKCRLIEYASLDMAEGFGSKIVVAATLEGHPTYFLIDTARPENILREDLPKHWGINNFREASILLGSSLRISLKFMRLRDVSDSLSGPAISGVLGVNALRNFDVEIDHGKRKVRLLEPTQCPEGPVHWPNTDVVAIPFETGDKGEVIIPVILDSQPLKAMVNTGIDASFVPGRTASEKFGLNKANPGGEAVRSTEWSRRGHKIQIHRRQFNDFSFAHFSFKNPWMEYIPFVFGWSRAEMELGMHQLQQLHLYFAFRQGILYASSVAGDRAAPGNVAGGGMQDRKAHVEGLLQRASSYLNFEQYGQSFEILNEALRLDPRNAEAYFLRCLSASELGRHKEALSDCGQAARLDPSDIPFVIQQCLEHVHLGALDKALALCNRARAMKPGTYASTVARGMVYLKMGRGNEAREDFDRALEIVKAVTTPVRGFRYMSWHGKTGRAQPLYGRGLAQQLIDGGGSNDRGRATNLDPGVVKLFAKFGLKGS